jgi:sugar O-acyltransferase (sialic acid O-acetyltransferase NeuD family)
VKTRRILVYGAGGHGKVIADILLSGSQDQLVGFIDDDKGLKGNRVLGFPVLGDAEWLRDRGKAQDACVALGVGDNHKRRELAQKCTAWNLEIVTLIHPRATVSSSAILGNGTVVMGGAVINAQAKIGLGVIVNTGAIVEHDVEIGDYAHISPNASLGGASGTGPLVHMGIGSILLPRVRVGAGSIVGAGAVVLRDLSADVVAVGIPAKIVRKTLKLSVSL